ncbi:MAG TPA: pilus assembly protein PilB, partial [Marinobacter adhaerens]|nr:pilus assembly protein PilB [Marinobacter adhaerens]
AISGQGDPTLLQRIGIVSNMAENPAGNGEQGTEASAEVIEGLKLSANIFVPVLNFLDSDLSISGVHYREGEPRYRVREDGALMLAFPERIEEIRMDNIRVTGGQGASMGNVSIHDIRFHPDSQMTIYTR